MDYTTHKMKFQQEWYIIQCINLRVRESFAPLEVTIRYEFLPCLLGVRRDEITDALYQRTTLDMN